MKDAGNSHLVETAQEFRTEGNAVFLGMKINPVSGGGVGQTDVHGAFSLVFPEKSGQGLAPGRGYLLRRNLEGYPEHLLRLLSFEFLSEMRI